MKTLQLALVLGISCILIPNAFGLESPGLKEVITIETSGYEFDVEIVGTFQVFDSDFSKDDKKMTLYLSTGLDNNLGEMQIPLNLINGNFTFFLDEKEIFPKVYQNDRISFITLEFEGKGDHVLEIIGTTYLPEFSEIAPIILGTSLFGLILLRKIHKIKF